MNRRRLSGCLSDVEKVIPSLVDLAQQKSPILYLKSECMPQLVLNS